MSAASENKWDAMRLAAAAIARHQNILVQLSEKLALRYTDSEIANIWRQARVALLEEDQCWLEDELYYLLANDSAAA